MRKELLDIQEVDRYLLRGLTTADRLVFQARMLLSPDLRRKVKLQEKTHQLVRWYGRDLQREQLSAIHSQLMAEENFSQQITSIFK